MTAPSPRFFGRRKGRPLNARKNALLLDLLPRVQIALPEKGVLDPRALFDPKPHAVWLEIGFGGGEHLAAQAETNPGSGYIGCEPFVNGVASLLAHMDNRKLSNIRIFPEDARQLLDKLPEGCLAGCFVLYPDPWPKKRHAERRFINAENLDRLARTLKPGAELRLATDVAGLADWMRGQVKGHPEFEIVYDSPAPPADWVETRYEKKGVTAGRAPRYLIGRRQT
ncbi:MAG: tRNA (guanine(46)-N(7))-methyltransferase TrmB [Alphaproteobacteria bacterium]|nr:tRNA (guanine(46)-N(7))-methyltransferase TrmB [Alphaproteobacteria bacterium]